MRKKEPRFVIGVDGGGTKTVAALANLDAEILKMVKSGPSNLRNLGIEKAAFNIAEAIKKASQDIEGKKILSCFVALAAVQEEYRNKKAKIKRAILEFPGLAALQGKIKIGSDQLVAFRTGTDEKDGMVLISGTGAVCHGWWREKEAKTSGWGWLNDEGAGFWVGQKAFQAVFKELDRRGKKTLIKDLIFEQLGVKNKQDLMAKVYQSNDFVRTVSLMSISVDEASKKGDKIAIEILKEAGEELALSAIRVIKGLDLEKKKFPLVLVGSMFKSKIVLETTKKEIKKIAPGAKFIRPKLEPVVGAVKLAIKQIEE